jgi:hydrogenase-4 component F
MERMRGLISTQPSVGWGLLIGTVAIAGFPPFGVFTSEFLLLSATMESWPWLAIPLLIGIAVAFSGLFRHLHPIVFGAKPAGQEAIKVNMFPVYLHLILVLWLGLAIPDFIATWFDQATRLITGRGLL